MSYIMEIVRVGLVYYGNYDYIYCFTCKIIVPCLIVRILFSLPVIMRRNNAPMV